MKYLLIILMVFSLFGCNFKDNSDEYYVAYESNFKMTPDGKSNYITHEGLYNENNELIDLGAYESKNEALLVLVAVSSNVDEPIKEVKMVLNDLIWEVYVETIYHERLYYKFDLKTHQFYDYQKDCLEFIEDDKLDSDSYYLSYVIQNGIDFNGLVYNVHNDNVGICGATLYPDNLFEYGEVNYINFNEQLTKKQNGFEIEFAIINNKGNNQKVVETLSYQDLEIGKMNTIIFYMATDNQIHLRLR